MIRGTSVALFRQVVAWLDPSDQTTQSYAADWARHLRLSLQTADSAEQVIERAGPCDLLVLGHRHRLRKIFPTPADRPAVLSCPDDWQPLSRVLLLHEGHGFSPHFVGTAARICRAVGNDPVVLTLAATEEAARQGEHLVREELLGAGLTAEFDFLAGPAPWSGVACVAHWRRCQAILWPRPAHHHWWDRWRKGPAESLAEAVAVLEIPQDLPEIGSVDQPAAVLTISAERA